MKLFNLSISAFAYTVLALLPLGANAEGPNQEDLAIGRDEEEREVLSTRSELLWRAA